MTQKLTLTAEERRLEQSRRRQAHWKRWVPYLSKRQWGMVREDYSAHGTAWDFFPHDHAHSRAYRWGEDGIAGISDRHQFICFALAMWNGRDPVLKERLFRLTRLLDRTSANSSPETMSPCPCGARVRAFTTLSAPTTRRRTTTTSSAASISATGF
jgi:hypothetical protein